MMRHVARVHGTRLVFASAARGTPRERIAAARTSQRRHAVLRSCMVAGGGDACLAIGDIGVQVWSFPPLPARAIAGSGQWQSSGRCHSLHKTPLADCGRNSLLSGGLRCPLRITSISEREYSIPTTGDQFARAGRSS